jgi:hypothetical protein
MEVLIEEREAIALPATLRMRSRCGDRFVVRTTRHGYLSPK